MTIDRIDKAILMQLQHNNRLSNIEIADTVGLSPPACLKRIKKLREMGAISADVSILSPKVIGNRVDVIFMVQISSDTPAAYEQFSDSMERCPEVTQCYQVVGENDFLLIASLENIQMLDHFSNRILRTDTNVKRFETIISKKRNKYITAIEF